MLALLQGCPRDSREVACLLRAVTPSRSSFGFAPAVRESPLDFLKKLFEVVYQATVALSLSLLILMTRDGFFPFEKKKPVKKNLYRVDCFVLKLNSVTANQLSLKLVNAQLKEVKAMNQALHESNFHY